MTHKIKSRTSLFGSWNFYKGALSLAVPIMLQQLIQNLVSLIDNFMVSGLGDISMSGVNVAGQVLFVFMVYLNTICMAGGIFMTQFFGADDSEGMKQTFLFKLIMGLAAFVPYLLVCVVFPRQVLSLMLIGNSDAAAILDEGVKYINIMFFMGLPMTVSMCIASSLRDLGRVKTPLVVTIIATLTNTAFNWLLIEGRLGFPKMGVRGAATATVIARMVELIIFTIIYIRTKPAFAISPRKLLHLDRGLFAKILRKGSLVLFCEMVWVLSETFTTAIYNGRGGADVVSGMAAGFAIANLFFIAFGGIYSATGVIIGKTLGMGKLEKARQDKTRLLSGSMVFGVFMMMFGFATTLIIPLVFGKLSDSAIHISRQLVMLTAMFMPVWVYMNAQQAVARAGGDTAMGAYVDSAITILVMMPMLFALGLLTNIGPVLMYLFLKLLDVVKVVIFHFWLKKERWLKNLTVEQSG
ncbi:putative efflux protein, MATE family [Ruminococcus sp. YE71]|uniref:MATE family efflux transporter n=1 Tax=unclassified Ruminococcus TaxID=2608920 RepID=UPI00088ABEA6|nr:MULTISPECIES: MATE family efflux transporter [unclassified Ruminococcus]SDA17436.1 putative efflux protein, MATE family [Ruminococcus sp. YE78]SFW26805.1 putative efflux protein, MATE family [Ruminococcus sp. YE71]